MFTVQITPLIRPAAGIIAVGDIITVAQYADLSVVHPLNAGRTAEVTLAIDDDIVADLEPYEFALRVLYEDRLEPVFWGQANISTDFDTVGALGRGSCLIEAQDPSLRLMHHYLRRGDTAITNVPETDKGTIDAAPQGLEWCIDAAQNLPVQDAADDPILGLEMHPTRQAPDRYLPIVVERGQECWQVMDDISRHSGGPDLDFETSWDRTMYARLATYTDLGTDRTSATPDAPAAGDMVLDYNRGANNLASFRDKPGRPTTHNHVLSGDAKYRRTGGSAAGGYATGIFVDWTGTDLNIAGGDDDALQELANARVSAYGRPPKFLEAALRPDAVIGHNYGHPNFVRPAGTRAPTFYIGDRATVRAVRGARSYNGPARITQVTLAQPGPRGPAVTLLKMVPTVGDHDIDEES